MPRAHRHYLAGQIWHLTHRCHERQFLLKFACDRQAWIGWLFEARQRFRLCVLDYMVTSNHIHLLVDDLKGREVIPQSIRQTAGRSGQEYNQRKKPGCFLGRPISSQGDRKRPHFRQGLVYIDLNRVRAGVGRDIYQGQKTRRLVSNGARRRLSRVLFGEGRQLRMTM